MLATITVLLSLVAYYDVLVWMVERYLGPDSYYSHGFLIPLVSGFLIWKKRHQLRALEPNGTWWGLPIVICALGLHLFGTIIYVFSFSGFTLFLLVWGFVLLIFGFRFAKVLAFPLGFLIFMFPVPIAVINMVSFPLKLMVAKIGVWIVSLTGIPIHLSGFNITIPAGTLLVGNPCSGLRSLITFMALGSIMAYISSISPVQRGALFLMSIAIAIISNLIRVPILVLVSHHYGLAAAMPDTWVHTGSGILVFALGILMLYATARIFEGAHAH